MSLEEIGGPLDMSASTRRWLIREHGIPRAALCNHTMRDVFRATNGLLTVEDFSTAKGDTLTIDKSRQDSRHQASDGAGDTVLTFGSEGVWSPDRTLKRAMCAAD